MILAGFHTRPLSWSNWNLEMLFFSEGSKTEAPGERPLEQDKTNNKHNSHMAQGQNRTRVLLVRVERSHHFPIPVEIN